MPNLIFYIHFFSEDIKDKCWILFFLYSFVTGGGFSISIEIPTLMIEFAVFWKKNFFIDVRWTQCFLLIVFLWNFVHDKFLTTKYQCWPSHNAWRAWTIMAIKKQYHLLSTVRSVHHDRIFSLFLFVLTLFLELS